MNAHRETLEAELQVLLRRHSKIEDHLRNANDELPQDWSDRATATENDEVLEALDDRTRSRIAALRVALSRMDDPDWGICVRCGATIPEKRLEAVPTTTLCVNCAEVLHR
jgi:RNA polymerase-binding protein DksA